MVVLDVKLRNIYGFRDFGMNFSYPKKIVNSLIEEEHLEGRPFFRYKKVVVLMGANATGKTSLGRAMLKIFDYLSTGNPASVFGMVTGVEGGYFRIDFVNEGNILHRLEANINCEKTELDLKYQNAEIKERDSYEKAVSNLEDHSAEATRQLNALKTLVGKMNYRFAYPEISPDLKFAGLDGKILLKTMRAVIGTLDPSLKDVTQSRDLKDSFIIRRKGEEIIVQDGKLLNREVLSSGTAEGVDISIFLASILTGSHSFYYCDEHFSYIQSDIEKKIFGLMMENLKQNEQLIFTTHNTDMLDLNLPKHSYAFLKKVDAEDDCMVSVVYASDILKRNTDSLRSAVENDVFGSLPDDSLLDGLERGWNER